MSEPIWLKCSDCHQAILATSVSCCWCGTANKNRKKIMSTSKPKSKCIYIARRLIEGYRFIMSTEQTKRKSYIVEVVTSATVRINNLVYAESPEQAKEFFINQLKPGVWATTPQYKLPSVTIEETPCIGNDFEPDDVHVEDYEEEEEDKG